MGELDDKLVAEMQDENVEHTGFRIFRDDGWDILINADQDLPKFEDMLESLHPSIKWTVEVSKEENKNALEYLDLTIIKSVGYRLNVNCSTDEFLDKRKQEYSRYLIASHYPPKNGEEGSGPGDRTHTRFQRRVCPW